MIGIIKFRSHDKQQRNRFDTSTPQRSSINIDNKYPHMSAGAAAEMISAIASMLPRQFRKDIQSDHKKKRALVCLNTILWSNTNKTKKRSGPSRRHDYWKSILVSIKSSICHSWWFCLESFYNKVMPLQMPQIRGIGPAPNKFTGADCGSYCSMFRIKLPGVNHKNNN